VEQEQSRHSVGQMAHPHLEVSMVDLDNRRAD
jgi:hypothetical protein